MSDASNRGGDLVNFIVYGVPRSGTTATVHYLNCHPEVFCGHEVFPENVAVSSLRYPSDFARMAALPNFAHAEVSGVIAEKTGSLKAIGNKTPRYYFADLAEQAGGRASILLARPAADFAPSWTARAVKNAPGWERGRIGALGLFEQLVCIEQTLRCGVDPLVIPFAALTRAPRETIETVFAHLGVDPAAVDQDRFDALVDQSLSFAERPPKRPPPALAAFAEESGLAALEAALHEGAPYRFSARAAALGQALRTAPHDVCERFLKLMALETAEHGEAATGYLARWISAPGVAPYFEAEAARNPETARRFAAVKAALPAKVKLREALRPMRMLLATEHAREARKTRARRSRAGGFDWLREDAA